MNDETHPEREPHETPRPGPEPSKTPADSGLDWLGLPPEEPGGAKPPKSAEFDMDWLTNLESPPPAPPPPSGSGITETAEMGVETWGATHPEPPAPAPAPARSPEPHHPDDSGLDLGDYEAVPPHAELEPVHEEPPPAPSDSGLGAFEGGPPPAPVETAPELFALGESDPGGEAELGDFELSNEEPESGPVDSDLDWLDAEAPAVSRVEPTEERKAVSPGDSGQAWLDLRPELDRPSLSKPKASGAGKLTEAMEQQVILPPSGPDESYGLDEAGSSAHEAPTHLWPDLTEEPALPAVAEGAIEDEEEAPPPAKQRPGAGRKEPKVGAGDSGRKGGRGPLIGLAALLLLALGGLAFAVLSWQVEQRRGRELRQRASVAEAKAQEGASGRDKAIDEARKAAEQERETLKAAHAEALAAARKEGEEALAKAEQEAKKTIEEEVARARADALADARAKAEGEITAANKRAEEVLAKAERAARDAYERQRGLVLQVARGSSAGGALAPLIDELDEEAKGLEGAALARNRINAADLALRDAIRAARRPGDRDRATPRLKEAIRAAEAAVKAAEEAGDRPAHLDALYTLGHAHELNKSYGDALRAYRAGARRAEDPREKGRFNTAASLILDLAPDSGGDDGAALSDRLATLLVALQPAALPAPAQDRLRAKLQLAETAVEQDARSPGSLLALAHAYRLLGQFHQSNKQEDQALDFYNKALQACDEALQKLENPPEGATYETRFGRLDAELRAERHELGQRLASIGKDAERAQAERGRWVAFANRVAPALGLTGTPLTERSRSDAWMRAAEDRINAASTEQRKLSEALQARTRDLASARAETQAAQARVASTQQAADQSRAALKTAQDALAALRNESGAAIGGAQRARYGEGRWSTFAAEVADAIGYPDPMPDAAARWSATPDPATEAWMSGLARAVKAAVEQASPTDPATARPDQYARSRERYAEALDAFYAQDYQGAVRKLDEAVALYARDARYYYFRGLALRALGDLDRATRDMRQGYALERKGAPNSYEVAKSLARVQFDTRAWVESFRNSGQPPAIGISAGPGVLVSPSP